LRQQSNQQRQLWRIQDRPVRTPFLHFSNTEIHPVKEWTVAQWYDSWVDEPEPRFPPYHGSLNQSGVHNVHDKLLTNKERQADTYNKGAKDLSELKSGDTVRLIPPRSLTNEAVKGKVNQPVAMRSYEVITEYGARYRRNRRH